MRRRMAHATALAEPITDHRVMVRAPEELTAARLAYLGEGVGKVVYASDHWVVKRERRPREILALIAIWRAIRKLEGYLPASIARNLLERPARQIRLLRLAAEAVVTVVPLGYWLSSHIGDVRRVYRKRDRLGELLAERRLAGTGLIAETITFPPVRVQVRGWPGWLVVEEATERVEQTLDEESTIWPAPAASTRLRSGSTASSNSARPAGAAASSPSTLTSRTSA